MTQNDALRILLVEDDATIAALVAEHLKRWGFLVSTAEDFSDVMGEFERFDPHLVILDVSLPYYSGHYWCSEIRRISKVPVLFLSSRADNMDIVMAMNMGGDDYVTKPFSFEVLVAKINALLRRAYEYYTAPQTLSAQGATYHLGDGTLEAGGQRIELTRNESRMLRLLMEQKGRIVTREALMRNLWDDEHFIDENTLTVNINRLRKKLSASGLEGLIETKKGEGYIIRD